MSENIQFSISKKLLIFGGIGVVALMLAGVVIYSLSGSKSRPPPTKAASAEQMLFGSRLSKSAALLSTSQPVEESKTETPISVENGKGAANEGQPVKELENRQEQHRKAGGTEAALFGGSFSKSLGGLSTSQPIENSEGKQEAASPSTTGTVSSLSVSPPATPAVSSPAVVATPPASLSPATEPLPATPAKKKATLFKRGHFPAGTTYTIPDLENLIGKELTQPSYLKGTFRFVERISPRTYRLKSEVRTMLWNFVGSTEFILKFPYDVPTLAQLFDKPSRLEFTFWADDEQPVGLVSVDKSGNKVLVQLEVRGYFFDSTGKTFPAED